MPSPLYPAKVAERERVRNQKILQDKLYRKNGQRRSAQDRLLAKIEKQAEWAVVSPASPYAAMDQERRVALYEARLALDEGRELVKAAAGQEFRQRNYERSVEIDLAPLPWINNSVRAVPSFPFSLTLTAQLSSYLSAQLLSTVRAEVMRAEILEPSTGGMVKVCVLFKRNGSVFVDQFTINLQDISNCRGVTAAQFNEIISMQAIITEPVMSNATPWWNGESNTSTGTLTFKDLDNAYNQAVAGFWRPPDSMQVELMERFAESLGVKKKTKDPKPITALDVINEPGHRMIEV